MSKVVIVSYDIEMRAMLKYSLDAENFAIYTAYNINEGIEYLKDDDLNVMIYDLDNDSFPRKVFENLCKEYHLLVILTGSDTKKAFNCFSDLITEFIIKPENYEDIFAAEYFEAVDCRIKRYFTENRFVIQSEINSNARQTRTRHGKMSAKAVSMAMQPIKPEDEQVIVMGASTGGAEALMEIIVGLSENMPPIVVVNGYPHNMTQFYIQKMNNFGKLYAKECDDFEFLMNDTVYFAPENKHVRLKRAHKRLAVETVSGKKVNGVIPSIDILFNSAAEVLKDNAIGVLLTGNGTDGAKGLFNLRDIGAKTIAQAKNTCVATGMVRAAEALSAIDMEVPLSDIATILQSLKK